jgi:hypothetical protein
MGLKGGYAMKHGPQPMRDGLRALKALRSKLDAASLMEVIQEDGHIFRAHFSFNPPARREEVEELKRALSVPLPLAYEQFLLQCNGALLYYGNDEYGQCGYDLCGTLDLIPVNVNFWKIYADEWPSVYLVFARSRGDTDALVLDTADFVSKKECRVIDGDRSYSPRDWTPAAPSFGEWLDRLVVAQGAKYWRWH